MTKLIDLTGQKFDRLLVVERILVPGMTKWKCICDCGKECDVLGINLKRGKQKSCGCKNAERITKHGESPRGKLTPEYRTWRNIKKRCFYDKDLEYPNYGGRGIKVCNRWLDSFENFLADMGKRPSPKHSIDRINVNGDYEPDNCRWVTSSVQKINQRKRHDNTSGCKGVSFDNKSGKWFSYISPGNKQKRISLGYFDNLEDAIKARKEAEIKYHSKALAK